MAVNLPLIPGTLPEGFCMTTWQQVYNDFFRLGYAQWPLNATTFAIGSSAPSDTSLPWLRLEVTGAPDRWYKFFNGEWVSKHPVPASGDEVKMWKGTLESLKSYDGGDGQPIGLVGETSGPMWWYDSSFDARFPLGAGELPGGSTVDVGDTGGEEEHVLVKAEMPRLTLKNQVVDHPDGTPATYIPGWKSGGILNSLGFYGSGPSVHEKVEIVLDGDDEGHNNMPPYKGVYFIKRTARIYYVAP